MLGERTTAWALALLLSGAAVGAQAQDAETDGQAAEAPPVGEPAGTGEQTSAQVTEPPAQPPAPPERPQTLDPPPPAPVMVVVLPERRVPAEAATAMGAALAEALDEPAGRREVHALGNPEILERIGACEDDACYGAVLAEARAAAGIFVRVSRRGRRYALVVEGRDPVSGTLRGEALEAQVERDAAPAEALAPHLEGVAALLPDPPPPDPTLLVTVNVDGAAVAIDGISLGESPVAPVTVASGFHEVSVTLGGYASVTRRTQVAPGDTGRVDVTMRPLSPEAVAAAQQTTAGGGQQADVFEEQLTDQWWFWTLIGGGALLVIGAIIVVAIVAGSGEDTNQMLPTGLPLPRIEGGMF